MKLQLRELPVSEFSSFVAGIHAPLGFGKVKLVDGREVPGFVCESAAFEAGAQDITACGSWRNHPSTRGCMFRSDGA